MRKKMLAIIMTIIFVLSMAVTGCSGASDKETDSGGGKTETETEAPAADDQQAESEESDEVTTEEEDAVKETEDSSAESETPDVVLTADTEITDEDIQEIYASIKESVTTEYLEPNGIDPADFSWPDATSTIWGDYSDRILMDNGYQYATVKDFFTEDELINMLSDYDNQYPSPDKEILDSVLLGIIDWMQTKGDNDEGYFSSVFSKLLPMKDVIPTNVTFN